MEKKSTSTAQDFCYFTTPIYYANGNAHAGHVYTTLLAQILKTHYLHRNNQVKLLTGLDEHGETVEQKANELKISPQQLVDDMALNWMANFKELGIQYDVFMRTTNPEHVKNVQDILNFCYQKGDIYFGTHEGRYCIKCESFLNSSEQDEDKNCLIHKRKTELRKESNYFFAISKYKDTLRTLIQNGAIVSQERYKNELLGLLNAWEGDLSISRPKERLSWGVELPFDANHVAYVWFDALPNYLTGIGGFRQAKENPFWNHVTHLLGKDILKFHGIFWPAMCLSLEIPLPKLLVHGWLLKDGHKMSKSLGNVITFEQICENGVDMFVNTIFRANLGDDIDLTWQTIFERFNADLANGVGNLLSRSLTLCKKQFNSHIPAFSKEHATSQQYEIAEFTQSAVKQVCDDFDAYQISSALNQMNSLLSKIDKYFAETTPWKLKEDEQKQDLANILYVSLASLRVLGFCFYAFFPKKFEILLTLLGENTTNQSDFFERAHNFWGLNASHQFTDIPRLFERLDLQKLIPIKS